MKYVFISYRRSDSSDITGRICDRLKARFGEDALFKDVDSIPIGRDFRAVISEAVGQCKILLAIIGDDWLGAVDQAGRRRIDDPGDYVHIEIASALKRGIPVVPVLVEHATMPLQDQLPEPLKEFSFRNGIPVRPDPDFHNDMDRLCRQLAAHVEPGRWRRIVPASGPRIRRVLPWVAGIGVALAVLAFALPKGDDRPIDDQPVPPVDGGGTVPSQPTPMPSQPTPVPSPSTVASPPYPPAEKARVRILYVIEQLPEVPGEDAAKLFNDALGSWAAEADIPMRRADSSEEANVKIRTLAGSGTVAHVGPPRPEGPALFITFDPEVPWDRRTFESASGRMIGHILGLATSETPGQLMSDASTGVSYETLPLVPQEEDIRRARAIWEDVP